MNTQMKWLLIIVFGIVAIVLNFSIIDEIIMPDPCYYHTKKMNFILGLFYSSSSASGGHPEINLFNIIFTFAVGGLIGNKIHRYLENKNCY
jgi:hypothetical protein